MLNDTFKEVLTHNGVVSVTTWSDGNAHVANTWNSYIKLDEPNKILIPVAWFHVTEKNIKQNNRVIVTLGSPDVQGKIGMGTGFVLEGSAIFHTAGALFDTMKAEFSFLTRVLEITATSIKQTI